MEIIVDGYNVIAFDQGLEGNLERKRTWLVQQLSHYKDRKGFVITVVFDAWNTRFIEEVTETRNGVRVLYSRQGEKADEVIVRITRAKGSSCVVITSDREVRRAVEKFGAIVVDTAEFVDILHKMETWDRVDMVDQSETVATREGNPRRLSKTERKRRETIRKLWI